MIAYYDTRNALIVNELINRNQDRKKILDDWKNRISVYHLKQDHLSERMAILGMWDFIRYMKRLSALDTQKNHRRIKKKRHLVSLTNKLLWRTTEIQYKKNFCKRYKITEEGEIL